VTEIMVNGPQTIYVEREGKLIKTEASFRNDEHLLSIIRRIAEPLGRNVDESTPMFDARLPDGSRVNAVIPPISVTGPTLTLRKFLRQPLTVEKMIEFGTVSEEIVTFLRACVLGRLNIAVAGGTGSGKTTFLRRVIDMIPQGERIVLIQNADEMLLDRKRLVKLESRPANVEGKGEVTIRDLVINSRSMRPDRVVVGEVRSNEALDVIQLMNTGHDGSMFSIHATSPRDVLSRLETLVLMANPSLPILSIRQQMGSAINLIVCLERMRDGSRKVVNVTEVMGMKGDVIVMQDIFAFEQTGFVQGRVSGRQRAAGVVPQFFNRFRELGIDLPIELFAPR
jgi:pilus assembly protein CpaF